MDLGGVAKGFTETSESFSRQRLQGAQTENIRAETGLRQMQVLNAQRQMQEAAAKQAAALKLQQAMQGIKLTGDFAQDQLKIAETALQNGDLDEAAKFLNQGSQAQLRVVQGAAQIGQAESALSLAEQRRYGTLMEGLAGVQDDETLENWNQTFEQTVGRPSPLKGKPFNPMEVQRVADAYVSMQGKQTESQRNRELARREAHDRVMENYRHNLIRVREREAQLRAENAERRATRAGADKPIPDPSEREVKEAATIIQKNFPEDKYGKMPLADRNLAGTSLYYRAAEKLKANPALNRETAYLQAFEEMKEKGYFQVEELGWIDKMRGKDGLSYSPGGGAAKPTTPATKPLESSPEKPLVLNLDKTTRSPGWYTVPGKGVYYWTGEGWDPNKARK
jgi:hypothetical protein